MIVGEIYYNPRHYVDQQTGQFKPKYFLLLALTSGRDLIVRVLTSRQHGRPENPVCSHADPYPAYFLGVPGDPLGQKTGLDLRAHPDIEETALKKKIGAGAITRIAELNRLILIQAMECAAAAPDTTLQQERHIRDTIAALRA